MWKCANDVFGYCSGEPDWETPPDVRENAEGTKVTGTFGGRCKNDKDSCEKYKTFTQVVEDDLLKYAQSKQPSTAKNILIIDKNTKADAGQQGAML